jgi:hypothetical protein
MSWSYGYTPGKLGFRLGDVLVGMKSGTTDTPEALKTDDGRMHTLLYAWDASTLSWVVTTTRGPGLGQEVYVPNLSGTDQAIRMDVVSSTVTYVGKASVSTVSNAASWKIFRMTSDTDGDLIIEYADGNANFDNVWDDRAALSYS